MMSSIRPMLMPLLVILVLLPLPSAHAEVTVAGFPACRTPAWLELMLRFQAGGDTAAMDRYQNRGQCVLLKDGLQVEVTGHYLNPRNQGRVEFTVKGFTYFTVPQALGKTL